MSFHILELARARDRNRYAARLLATTLMLALVTGGSTGLSAQEVSKPAAAQTGRSDEGSRWASYGMGLGFGMAGFTLGAIIGAQFEGSCQELECFDEAFVVGSALGSIGVATGIHLGNGSRGNIWLDLLASVGSGMAGAGIALAIDDDPGSAIVAVTTVVVQLALTTEVERATGRARAPHGDAASNGTSLSLGVAPTVRHGRLGAALAGHVSF